MTTAKPPVSSVENLKHVDGAVAVKVRRFDTYDVGALRPPKRLDNGFLLVEGRISRAGIQQYEGPDGQKHFEFRPEEEVFDPASIESFAQVPVTNTHPTQLLDASTARQHAVGSVGENLRRDGDYLAAPMMVYDADAIRAIDGGRVQLSCGYDCELEQRPGVWEGQSYEFVQRRIRGNHVALVDVARAGPDARMRLDANDARMVAFQSLGATDRNQETHMALRIDGLTFDVTDANAGAIQQAVDRAVASAEKRSADATSAEKSRADSAEKRLEIVKKNALRAIDKLDAKKEELKKVKHETMPCPECKGSGKVSAEDDAQEKCDYCDGKGKVSALGEFGGDDGDGDDDEEEMDANELEVEQATEEESKGEHEDGAEKAAQRRDAAVKRQAARIDWLVTRRARERTKLVDVAQKLLGAETKLDGLDVAAIKRAVVAKAAPRARTDDKDLDAQFRLVCAMLDGAPNGSDAARAAAMPSLPKTEGGHGVHAARERMIKHNQDAWKTAK